MVATGTHDGDTWSLASLLRSLVVGDSCSCQVQKQRTLPQNERAVPHQPVVRVRGGGDCGPDTAAWLLNEHGPELYRSRAPETRLTVRAALQQAWRRILDADTTGDDAQTFVLQRLEQVPEAQAKEVGEVDEDMGLHEQVALTLKALLRDEDNALTSGGEGHVESADAGKALPYWFLPSDWARLSEAYQVDFVVHGLPGTENRHCAHCNSKGHVHFGPRGLGVDMCLHVCWRSAVNNRRQGNSLPNDVDIPKSNTGIASDVSAHSDMWGHWEPLGAGQIERKEIQVYSGPPGSMKRLSESGGEVLEKEAAADGCPQSSLPKLCSTFCSRGFGVPGCQEESPCDSSCPNRNCHGMCPFCEKPGPAQRENSDEDPTIQQTLRAVGGVSSGARTTPQTATVVSEAALHTTNAGARFCIFLEGVTISFGGVGMARIGGGGVDGNGGEGGTGGTSAQNREDVSSSSASSSPVRGAADAGAAPEVDLTYRRFREAFAAGIATVAAIAPSRVKVLEVGPPLGTVFPRSPAGATGPRDAATPRGQQRGHSPLRVDTGAGVLSFLEEETPAEEPEPAVGHNPSMAPAADRAPVEQALRSSSRVSSDAGSGGSYDVAPGRGERGVTRILFLIRDTTRSVRGGTVEQAGRNDEEMEALRALEMIVESLKISDAALLSALRPWLVDADGDVRLRCPEISRSARSGGLAISRTAAQRGLRTSTFAR